jgi:hypothetical protein
MVCLAARHVLAEEPTRMSDWIERPRPRWLLEALSLLTPYDAPLLGKLRIGNNTDGGYIMFDDFDRTAIVYSFGIGGSVSFDLQLAQMGKQVFMFDHTIDGLPVQHPNFSFHRLGLGSSDAPEESLLSLAGHVAGNGHAGRTDLALKMDVEGAEFAAIIATPTETLRQFRQLVIEVHSVPQLAHEEYAARFIETFSKINSVFNLCHVHANNCAPLLLVEGMPIVECLELSYIRKDVAAVVPSRTVYPTDLDFSNKEGTQDMLLWFYPFLPVAQAAEGEPAVTAMLRSFEAAEQSIRARKAAATAQELAATET